MMDAGTLDFATFMNTMRNDNGFGGNNSWIWILFLFFFFGGYGGFGMNRDRMATAAEQQLSTDFIYSNLNSQIRGMNEGLIQGFSGLNTNLLKGFDGIDKSISASTAFTGDRINGLERGICNLGYELKSTIDNCCCTTGKAIQQFGYENQLGILNQTNALNQTMSALGDKIDAQTAVMLKEFCDIKSREQQFGYENQLGILNQTNALNQTMSALGDKIDAQTAVMLKEFCDIKSREDARQITELTAQLNDVKTANLMAAQTANITAQLNSISCSIPPKPIPAYFAPHCWGGYPYYPCNPNTGTGTTPATK